MLKRIKTNKRGKFRKYKRRQYFNEVKITVNKLEKLLEKDTFIPKDNKSKYEQNNN